MLKWSDSFLDLRLPGIRARAGLANESSYQTHSECVQEIPSAFSRSTLVDASAMNASLVKANTTAVVHVDSDLPRATALEAMLANITVVQYLLEVISAVPGGFRILSCLSCTCKAFYYPTISVLWRHLRSIEPFTNLFPHTFRPDPVRETFSKEAPRSHPPSSPRTWSSELLSLFASWTCLNRCPAVKRGTGSSDIQEPQSILLPLGEPLAPVPPPYWQLTPETWNRIVSYGRHIRMITLAGYPTPQMEEVLAYLTSTVQLRRDASLLLPSLATLHWSCSPSTLQRSTPLLIQPSLHEMNLELHIDTECDFELGKALARIAQLQHLTNFTLTLLRKPSVQIISPETHFPLYAVLPQGITWEEVRISVQLANTIGQLPSSLISLLRSLPVLPRLRTLQIDLSYSRMDDDLRMLFPMQRPEDDDLYDALFGRYPEPVPLPRFMHLRDLALGPIPLREAVPFLYHVSGPLQDLQLMLVRSRSHSTDDALGPWWKGFCKVLTAQFVQLRKLNVEECDITPIRTVCRLDTSALGALVQLEHIRFEMHSAVFAEDVRLLWPSAKSVDICPMLVEAVASNPAIFHLTAQWQSPGLRQEQLQLLPRGD